MIDNPFIVKGYAGKDLFCDREKETDLLLKNVTGGSDLVIVSPRRYGKSGLIYRAMEELKTQHPEFETLYCDISSTTTLNSFIDCLASAIMNAFPEKSSLGKKFLSFLKGLKPFFTVNQYSGQPEVHLEMTFPEQKSNTLKQILGILENHPSPVMLAIDEFQQITDYPETNVEALLRTYIQHMHNVRFIFCGSKRRMMISIFNDASRPFYASTSTLHLQKLDRELYGRFIRKHFEDNGREVTEDALQYILDWTRCHTYYTQKVCHDLYYSGKRIIDIPAVLEICRDILEAESYNYMLLREILPVQQWRFLIGVAKEGSVSQITSANFISKHKIGSTTTAVRCAESLEEKELIIKHLTRTGASYEVYDVFFSRWLEQEF